MSLRSNQVLPHPRGGWAVLQRGATRATRVFPTQEEARAYARRLSKRQGSDLYIHRRDGTVRTIERHSSETAAAVDAP